RNLKIDSRSRRTFDLSPQPFRILRVGAAATNKADEPGGGQPDRAGSADVLIFEREVLLNPARRLIYELSCPLDCPPSEVEALYVALSNSAASTDELLKIHSAAAFVGYDVIEGAIEPVLGCTRQVLDHGERHLMEALGSLLGPYRQFIEPLQKDAAEHVASACVAVREQPGEASLI